MILNEDYFKDIEITDDDINSSEDDVLSSYDKYATPEEWFAGMKSRYTYCIEIPLSQEYQWKQNFPLILKRLLYMFDAYRMEYSETTLQDFIHVEDNLMSGYSQCNFIDYNGYKLISSKYKTIEDMDKNYNTLSIVIFFNLPEVHSYKAACLFISNILSCIRDMTLGSFLIWDSNTVPYGRKFLPSKYMNYRMIETIIKLFFPEKKYDDIEKELYADNKALMHKLLRCFGQYNDN